MKSVLIALLFVINVSAQEQVTIQLKWFHQFQFAGYYAAKEKGFYAEEGLDVSFKQYDDDENYIETVLNGGAQYGVSDGGLVIYYLNGEPVVLVAQIFQHSPLVLISTKESGIVSPYDLLGKRVMMDAEDPHSMAAINAMFLQTVDHKEVNYVQVPYSYDYADLFEGRVDAVCAYCTDMPYGFQKEEQQVNIIDPRNYGIDIYGDNLFTTESELFNHPERVEKMKRATLKGWKYALENPEEIVDIIIQKYNSQNRTKTHLLEEARQTARIILPNRIELGDVNLSRYIKTAEVFSLLGLVDRVDVKADFIYDKNQKLNIDFTAEERLWIKQNPTVILGLDPNWPPFEAIDNSGNYVGISADYIHLIAKLTGLKFEMKRLPWTEIIEGLQSGSVDMSPSMTISPERINEYNFSEPYIFFPGVLTVRKGESVEGGLKNYTTQKVGTTKGYIFQEFLAANYPNLEVDLFSTPEDGLFALSTGEIDLFIGNLAVLSHQITKHSLLNLEFSSAIKGMERNEICMGFHKGNPMLVKIIDKALQTIPEEKNAQIARKWIDVGFLNDTPINLTNEELTWLNEHSIIRAKVGNSPPNHFWEQGPKGVSVEYLNRISKLYGFKVEYIRGGGWEESLNDLRNHTNVDMFLAIADLPEFQDEILFSDEYLDVSLAIYMHDNNSLISGIGDLEGKTVAIPANSVIKQVLTENYPKVIQQEVDSEYEALKAVSRGDADAFIGEVSAGQFHIIDKGIENVFLVAPVDIDDIYYAFGVRNDWSLFVSILNKGLRSISYDEQEQIHDKYYTEFVVKEPFNYSLILGISFLILLIIVLTILWNRMLRKQIVQRTFELNEKSKKLKELADKRAEDLKILNQKMEETDRFNRLAVAREQRIVELKEKLKTLSDNPDIQSYNSIDESEIMPFLSSDFDQPLRLEDILHNKDIYMIIEHFCKIIGISAAIINDKGVVSFKSNWRRACTDFHRKHETTSVFCTESDVSVARELDAGKQFSIYKCKNGILDAASPVVIDGKRISNVYLGQFFDQPPNLDFFRAQAKKYGFDEEDYIAAIKEIPIFNSDEVRRIMEFLVTVGKVLGEMSKEKLISEKYSKELINQRTAAMSLAEDALRARTKLSDYKNQLELKVAERTKELGEAEMLSRISLKLANAGSWYIDFHKDPNKMFLDENLIRIQGEQFEKDQNSYSITDWRANISKSDTLEGDKFLARAVENFTNPHILEWNAEHRYIRPKDQREIWLKVRAVIKRDEKGDPLFIHGVSQDITEQKRIGQEKEKTLLRHQITQEMAQLGTWYIDYQFDTSTIYIDESLKEIQGEWFSRGVDSISSEVWLANIIANNGTQGKKIIDEIQVIFSDPRVFDWHFSFRYCRPIDGRYIWLQTRVVIKRDTHGAIIYIHGVTQDITQQKRAEQSLKQSQKSMEEVLNSVPIGVTLFDVEERTFFFMNDTIKAMLEIEEGEISSFTGETVIKDIEEFRTINTTLIENKSLEDRELKMIRLKSREEFWAQVSVSRKNYLDKKALLICLYDTTQTKELQLDLQVAKDRSESANIAKSAFLANMSHEIRTPMNSILGFSEILKKRVKDPVNNDFLESICTSGRDLLDLINDILDFSKIEAGKFDLNPTPTNVPLLINELSALFSLRAKDKGLLFTVLSDIKIPQFLILDEMRLKQILMNFLSNALKFTDIGSILLSVDVVENADHYYDITFKVSDSGIGISKDEHTRIFEAFKQQDQQDNRKFGGTGLGLSISNSLVQLMGSTIELESKLGYGSTFFFTLRNVQKATSTQIIVDDYIDTNNVVFDEATVLIIDDNSANRSVVKGLLAECTSSILEAGDAKSGIELAKKNVPSLILMDLKMPEIDGYQALKLIKKIQPLSTIPVIALTASVVKEEVEKCLAFGFDGFLPKPLEEVVLIKKVMELLPYTFKEENLAASAELSSFNPMDLKLSNEAVSALNGEGRSAHNLYCELSTSKHCMKLGVTLRDIGRRVDNSDLEKMGEDLLHVLQTFNIEKMDQMLGRIHQLFALFDEKKA